jgi:hypothetical protein
MISFLRKFLSPDYLLVSNPGPLGGFLWVYIALGILFAIGMAAHLFRRKLLTAEGFILGVGLLSVTARLLGIPFLSARVWLFTAIGGKFLQIGVAKLRRHLPDTIRSFLRKRLKILVFHFESEEPLSLGISFLLIGIHLAGLGLLWGFYGFSPMLALPSLLLLLSPGLVSIKPSGLERLTPLFYPYAVAIFRSLLSGLGVDVSGYDGFAWPDPLSPLLDVNAALLAGMAYVLLLQGHALLIKFGHKSGITYLGLALLFSSLLWVVVSSIRHYARGVTASDPYCYVQMALDIARKGTPLHTFHLFPLIARLRIPWWPVVHVGYHLPLDAYGNAATVWPVGGSLLLALGYILLGEKGLYLTMPFINLLSLVGLFSLAWEVFRRRPPGERLLICTLAFFLLATSSEQIHRTLVPMVDAATQLFTTLLILFTLKAARGRQCLYGFLAGLSFGWAYFVKHTQLVLIFFSLVMFSTIKSLRRIVFLLPFCLASFLVVLPDLMYHQIFFGSFLRPESPELPLFSLSHVASNAQAMLRESLKRKEFGFLLPFIIYGGYKLWQEERKHLLAFFAWFLAVNFIHLPYGPLRLRDLISLFPAVVILAAYGVVSSFKTSSRTSDRLLVICFVAISLAMRTYPILHLPFREDFNPFGHLTEEQRGDFALLKEITPSGSLIGTSLNGGAIELYGGRMAFRPAYWSEEDFQVFINAMFEEGKSVYILEDGTEMHLPLEWVRQHYLLSPKAELDVPYFLKGGESPSSGAVLYEISAFGGKSLERN